MKKPANLLLQRLPEQQMQGRQASGLALMVPPTATLPSARVQAAVSAGTGPPFYFLEDPANILSSTPVDTSCTPPRKVTRNMSEVHPLVRARPDSKQNPM